MLDERLCNSRVVVIDDIPSNLRLIESSLKAFGLREVFAFTDSRAGLDWLQNNNWDLLLLDLDMPVPSGFDILHALGQRDRGCNPVIIVTALNDPASRRRGLDLGASDYVCKPVDLQELLLRVRNSLQLSQASQALQRERDNLELIVQQRTLQLVENQYVLVSSLCRAAEYKDNETGNHILRIGESAALLARAIGCDDDWVNAIWLAAPMHDIGKIGIPDEVLLKPGLLTAEERELMNTHTQIGYEILKNNEAPLIQMAADIALHHHEKWDGTGYPMGLKGEAIPLSACIVALCDVYDALRSRRPYKEPWSAAAVQQLIRDDNGQHFDPALVQAMCPLFDQIEALHERYRDGVEAA